MPSFATFDEFFPYYMRQHGKPATRWFHFAGTQLGAAAGIAGVIGRKPMLVAAAPAIAYGLAWFSHAAIERNRPATFGHPLWSAWGDLRMLKMMWQGRDSELSRIAGDHGHLTLHTFAAA